MQTHLHKGYFFYGNAKFLVQGCSFRSFIDQLWTIPLIWPSIALALLLPVHASIAFLGDARVHACNICGLDICHKGVRFRFSVDQLWTYFSLMRSSMLLFSILTCTSISFGNTSANACMHMEAHTQEDWGLVCTWVGGGGGGVYHVNFLCEIEDKEGGREASYHFNVCFASGYHPSEWVNMMAGNICGTFLLLIYTCLK